MWIVSRLAVGISQHTNLTFRARKVESGSIGALAVASGSRAAGHRPGDFAGAWRGRCRHQTGEGIVGKALDVGAAAGRSGREKGNEGSPRKQARPRFSGGTHDWTHSLHNSSTNELIKAT